MSPASGVGILFFAIGAALSAFAIWHFVRRRAFVRNSDVASGTIVALREDRDGTDITRVRFPKVRFRTAAGGEVTFESGMGRSGRRWAIGSVLPVRYQRDRPEIAEFDRFAALWGPALAFALLGVVFMGVGAIVLSGVVPE